LWDGTAWRPVPASLPAGALGGQLVSVSCKPTGCVAAGTYRISGGRDYPLAASWNGIRWTLVKPPVPAGGISALRGAYLNGVSCWAAAGCVAIGTYYVAKTNAAGNFYETLTAGGWKAHDMPPVAAVTGTLDSITCVSATDCVAVGDYLPKGGHFTSLIESWNGRGWTRLAAPATAGHDVILDSVSCTSAISCVATGNAFTTKASSRPRTIGITEILSGTTWRLVTPAWPPGRDSFLGGVSCTSPARCLLVGSTSLHVNNDYRYPYAATWNGGTWTPVAVPAPPKAIAGSKDFWAAGLGAVTCVTATSCVVTGWEGAIHSSGDYGVVGTWNAGAWRLADLAIR
jgi:hypothetical protein